MTSIEQAIEAALEIDSKNDRIKQLETALNALTTDCAVYDNIAMGWRCKHCKSGTWTSKLMRHAVECPVSLAVALRGDTA